MDMEQGVLSATEAIGGLMYLTESMGLDSSIEGTLSAKLKTVQDSLLAENAQVRKDTANKLAAFINAVAAQSGKGLTEEQAVQLIRSVELIIPVLDADAAPAKRGSMNPSGKLSAIWGKMKAQ